MAVSYSGTIELKHPGSAQRVLIQLSYAPSFEAVQQFAAVLHTLTTADIIKCTFTQSVDPQLFGSGGELSDLGVGAHVKMRRTDPDADVRFFDFRVPAPKAEILEHIPERGYRVKETYGDTLTAAVAALRQEGFTFDRGWLT